MKKTALYSAESSLSHLTTVYNGIKGVKTIKKFTCSKTEALAKIEKAMAAADEQKGVCKPGPRTGVCQQMTELFSKGMDPKAVFEWVQKNLPKAKTSLKAVYWYRSYLRSQGALV